MKSRYWYLLSAMLLVAAGYFWHLGEQKRAAHQPLVPIDKKDSLDSQKGSSAKAVSSSPATSAKELSTNATNNASANSVTNSVLAKATNEALLFPHRLKNTTQSLKQLVRNDRAILLRNAWIDTAAERVKIPDELRSKGDSGSYIVQARGPVDATFRAALLEANAEIISYVPNNAYLVRLPNGSAKLAQNKQVSSVLPYEPYYKLDTELLGMAVEKKELPPGRMLRVGLFPGQRDAAIKALQGHAQIVGEDLKSSPFGPELIVASADLVHLANLPQVQEIEPYYERQIMNDLTRVTLGVSSNSTATANYLDLSGANVWVNVNDTPIDNSHPDLSGRIFPGAGVAVVDTVGHGTHVAGIIASSGANGPTSGSITNFGSVSGANFRGQAPLASILSFDIFAGLSDAEIQQAAAETNYVELNRQSPLISNNSWGYGAATYNSSAASFDAAVRDALPGSIGSQPIVYVFSAGNSGEGGRPGTVNSPATAKNVISVGALESNRGITNEVVDCHSKTNQPFLDDTDSSDEVAYFSSRGNVGILLEGPVGRLKPDVVAPGTSIISTRSQQFDEASYYSPLRTATEFSPGLVIDPFATNNFSQDIPDAPCGEGATLSLTIEAIPIAPVSPDVALLIYTGTAPNPSSGGTFQGANSVTIDRANLPLAGTLNYDIVNTNDFEITYNLRTTLVLSNDFGTYFQVLSNLNAEIGPYYRFESGTSMSAPAISGMLALMQEFFEQRQITNSPAMMKALLINGSRSVGSGYNREAALNNEGWGLPDIRRIIPEGTDRATWPVQLFDQSTNFTLATGERHDRVVTMNDTNSPLRITLVWTDPPGNPAVGTKLVNDLDLVVTTVVTNGLDTNAQPVVRTNVYFGNNFSGGEFTQASVPGTNGPSEFDAVRDSVNNVENIYINAPVSGQYTVSVVGRRVNVNAVTAHTNGIVQDYALVIASGNGTDVPFTVTTNVVANTNSLVTVVSNGFPLLKQRVGANSPLQNVKGNNLTDGTNTQWAFYVLNNPSNFTNIAFLTFLPPNLSGATNTVPGSRRVVDADIDMYVSTDPSLTNLNPAAIAASDKSLKRGGQELIVYTNRSDAVFYVGIKSEDQRASEFSFFAVASDTPFSNEENGNIIIPHGFPAGGADVPDGSPESPGGAYYIMIAATGGNAKVGRVVVTNQVTHERIGDLITTLTHQSTTGEDSVALLNHSFPDGQETGTFTGIYDDSGLDEGAAMIGSRPTDGPGSLLDFVGAEAVGAWIITAEDNSVNFTGRVDFASMLIERALETNDLFGADGFTISGDIGANQSRAVSFIVPPNTTNMIISISPKEGPLDTVVRRGRLAPTRGAIGGPYVDKGALISPPGASLTVGATDVPPLKPGRYVLRLFNDNGTTVNFSGRVEFQLDLTARSIETYSSSGPAQILDDAMTNSIIHVDRDGRVVSTEVSVHIAHPRVSDLVLHLVSPNGTRILLAENRGGLSTNGYGFSNLQTNVFPTTTFGGGTSGQTNTFGPILKSGFIRINYEFYDQDPDQMQVYYDGRIIYDTGIVLGSNSILIPYGPGTATDIVVVMNPNGNPSSGTAWEYTVTVLSGDFVYATFSENTNLARVPIKFAIPPFATNIAGLSTNTLMSSYFESDTAGTYTAAVDGWTVTTNAVDVVADATQAHRGTNYLSLGSGGISRTLPTVAGEFYNLKFGYRRAQAGILSGANIVIEGVLTNEFIGSPSWIVHSTSFLASKNGTQLYIQGVLPGMWFDTFELTKGGDPNYFLPEESLKTLIGENAKGDWKLEVWDNRAGAPLGASELVSWQLNLTFASTNATATTLTNATQVTNTVAGSDMKYFIIDVPIFATHATNVLVSGGGPLNLWFNEDELPLGNPALDDVMILSSTMNGTAVLTTMTFPDLRPGRRYYLGVQNANPAQTNFFTLSVTFDDTNNLVNVTPLTNATPYSAVLPLSQNIQYYQYDLLNPVSGIQFKLFNMTADADLVVRRDELPTENVFDWNSNRGGTNDEIINVAAPAPGRYYLGVYGFSPTNSITYSIVVTEGTAAPAPAFSNQFTLSPSGFHITANTIVGRTYEFEVSEDLVTWTLLSTTTATANVTTFTDPTSPSTQAARFYRLRLLP